MGKIRDMKTGWVGSNRTCSGDGSRSTHQERRGDEDQNGWERSSMGSVWPGPGGWPPCQHEKDRLSPGDSREPSKGFEYGTDKKIVFKRVLRFFRWENRDFQELGSMSKM